MSGVRWHHRGAVAGLASVLVCVVATSAAAQRTDVVTLANGDRITGEVTKLDRGQLEFKTDDAGTLYLEWDKLVGVTSSMHIFEITTVDGLRYVGRLGQAAPRSIQVVAPDGTTLTMTQVSHIMQIGQGFWQKLDGSISTGFSYTQSSGVAQLNFNADTTYRKPAFQVRFAGSYTATVTDDDPDPTDRGSIEGTYARFLPKRLILLGIGRLESNESLGLLLRSEGGVGLGPSLVDTNRAQIWVGAGVMVNNEHGVDVEPTQNIEAAFFAKTSYFTYDRPKTTIDIGLQYLPSLNEPGRQRVQLDAGVKRELLKDFIISLNLYDSYDNRPPNAAFDTNDVGIALTFGWTY
jgi:hypothetical protein